ncbi:MAG: cytochrome c biogenesis protein [Candidatus Dormibacter sp.]|uniref:cytochrome c biogenesis protein n=1 Tax=Candidatus Dormibacter sp. TaxID=2973982 RepID=UPI000DB33CA1|nr:MAG: cytochrome C assembly protein [Candidatus Dormibacteraeota bacterium]
MTEHRLPYVLTAAGVVALLGALAMVFLYAPQDAVQGPVQRIFYLHVSAAIAGFACFAIVVVASATHLVRPGAASDRLAHAAAQVGLVMLTVNISMGIVWAKPIWGWDPSQTWDARFTTTVVLWLIYAGYLLVRKFASPGWQASRLAAVVGIFGFIDVPIVYFSVQWWRTLHPSLRAGNGQPALPFAMLLTFGVTVVATLILTAALVSIRYSIEQQAEEQEGRATNASLELAR